MVYEDDPYIDDNEALWRRVPADQLVRGQEGEVRPSSQAFQNSSDGTGMSANIAAETTVERTMTGYEEHFLVEFPAELPRRLQQGIMRVPLENEPAHVEIFGNKSKGVRKTFTRECVWVLSP